MITQGEWKVSPAFKSAIVTDFLEDHKNTFMSKSEIEAYGGALIAESIKGEDNIKLIVAAPKLLKACQNLLNMTLPMNIHEQLTEVRNAVNEATL